MPKERKDTKPAAQEEDAQLPSAGFDDSGEITAVADQLAAVTFATDGEVSSGTSSQQDVDEPYDPLSDPELWKPHPPTEDCPVCFVPLPPEYEEAMYKCCCGKTICIACIQEHSRAQEIVNRKRENKELPPLDKSCPFCRELDLKSDSELLERIEGRIDKGDVYAMLLMGRWCQDGQHGLRKDEDKGKKLLKRAADMGSAKAMSLLGMDYYEGSHGVLEDKKKGFGYFEDALKAGDVPSRCVLASVSAHVGNFHLANKHLRFAAEAGSKVAVKLLWIHFSEGNLSKAELEEILRAHQSAYDKMDSEHRQRYYLYDEAMAGNDDILKSLYARYYSGLLDANQLEQVLKIHRSGGGLEGIHEFLSKCRVAK